MLDLRVHCITNEALGIHSFELRHPANEPLPPFTAGAHIDVQVPGGFTRSYSLCNAPSERHRYLIGVLEAPDSRGGSHAMHTAVRPGSLLRVSAPKNHFPLAEGAARHLLLAGGIGITPLLAMAETLAAAGIPFELHYCSRSPERTAFLDRLEVLRSRATLRVHHDGGDPSRGLDLAALLREPGTGTHLYYCGPTGFMAAARAASTHWPADRVHFEYFAAPATPPVSTEALERFRLRIASTGAELDVEAGQSMLAVLRAAGLSLESSCEAGVCGTCRTRYLEGEPEHHDYVLAEDERAQYLMPCCAKSRSEVLTLDL